MDQADPAVHRLQQFRQAVYDSFPLRADALMELLDALTGNTTARSVVELSLNPLFRRGYSSITDAIDGLFAVSSQATAGAASGLEAPSPVRLVAPYAPQPDAQTFWLMGQDATSLARPFAETLADRSFV